MMNSSNFRLWTRLSILSYKMFALGDFDFSQEYTFFLILIFFWWLEKQAQCNFDQDRPRVKNTQNLEKVVKKLQKC